LDGLAFKANPFITLENWLLNPAVPTRDSPITFADRGRHVGDFVPSKLPRIDGTTQALERLKKKGSNEVRLQPSSLCAIHFFFHSEQALFRHRFLSESIVIKQFEQVLLIESLIDLFA
jgi:hypothetical protein